MPNSYDKSNPLMMSAEFLLGCVQAAEEIGADLYPSLRISGIPHAQLVYGEGFLPLHKIVTFLNDMAERAQCPHFGLLVAKHQPPARFAMFGRLIRFARDLGQAIEDSVSFSLLNSEYTLWELITERDAVNLIRRTRVIYDAPMLQMRTAAMAVVYKSMTGICQRPIELSQVNFDLAPPTRPERWQQFFGCPVLFNQPVTSLILPRSALNTPIPTADREVHGLLAAHLRNLSEGLSPDASVVARVRHKIRETVGSRHCHLERISEVWGVHPRSLQRTLKEHGTSFRALLLDVRQELAEEYLRQTSISVSELSDILGYRNASAFSRTFKAQSGVAPDHWRAQHRI